MFIGILFLPHKTVEESEPDIINAEKQLLSQWPAYQKSIDFRTLASKFDFDDLLRVVRVNSELNNLLLMIGLK
ncbi:MAG: hypothetical protein A3E87_01270 [Gammaproteobacteria bacterium RIFCSPHIGHO2_12_FULL_35_23]|nr:MAG: hypothetical protein A3E87_01270 [Gammaproteobacteria bacterium RIFCSPHIGHO2_12_FULL_35_23]